MVVDIGIIIESAEAGKSEQNHIVRILDLKKYENNIYLDLRGRKIMFYKMKGKGELLKEENYNGIVQKSKKFLFILDADENFNKTQSDIQSLIGSLVQKFNIKADYFISCNPHTKKGNIETLLLECVKENLKTCYRNFLKCMGKDSLDKCLAKNLLQKMFEIKQPPYELDCEYFNKLRNKFSNL
ncbi:MAG: hypothetical protein ABGX26_04895 [Nautiliaceae bacterium]